MLIVTFFEGDACSVWREMSFPMQTDNFLLALLSRIHVPLYIFLFLSREGKEKEAEAAKEPGEYGRGIQKRGGGGGKEGP